MKDTPTKHMCVPDSKDDTLYVGQQKPEKSHLDAPPNVILRQVGLKLDVHVPVDHHNMLIEERIDMM